MMKMTFELWSLIYMGSLVLLLGVVNGVAKLDANGLRKMLKRDNLVSPKPWGVRAQNALLNLYESLPLYIVLVIAAQLTGLSNSQTLLGSGIFVAARTLHPIFYILGVWPLRSLCYAVGVAGMILMGLQLR